MLNALSVYSGYAPTDPWPAPRLEQLRTRHLVTFDGRGGVALLPGVRTVVLRSLSAEQREDLHQAAAAVHAARAEYTLAANSSNSFRSGFVRHVWRAFATLELPSAFLVSAQLDLQRVVYDDPQFITLETFIEDENRSSGKLRVERPLAGRWSGVMYLGAWLSPFGGGPAFSRQTALLGVACHLED